MRCLHSTVFCILYFEILIASSRVVPGIRDTKFIFISEPLPKNLKISKLKIEDMKTVFSSFPFFKPSVEPSFSIFFPKIVPHKFQFCSYRVIFSRDICRNPSKRAIQSCLNFKQLASAFVEAQRHCSLRIAGQLIS